MYSLISQSLLLIHLYTKFVTNTFVCESLVDDLVVTFEIEIADMPETTSMNPNDKTNYQLYIYFC